MEIGEEDEGEADEDGQGKDSTATDWGREVGLLGRTQGNFLRKTQLRKGTKEESESEGETKSPAEEGEEEEGSEGVEWKVKVKESFLDLLQVA